MKPFLTWLTLGAILFLCSCEENRYKAQAYQPTRTPVMQEFLDNVTPALSYSSEITTLNKPDFSLSFEEDLQSFHAKVEDWAERKARRRHRLRGGDLRRALVMVDGTEESAAVITADLHTVQAY